jgi:hypothetical protein
MLIAYYFMWHTGHPAAEQCEGCTWVTEIAPESTGHGLPLSKCEAYDRVYDQSFGSH